MNKAEKFEHRYVARVHIGEMLIDTVAGHELEDLITLINTRVDAERSGAEGEIVDMVTEEVVYRCRKQPASE